MRPAFPHTHAASLGSQQQTGRTRNQRGYTIIELVLTLILLGAISTVLLPFFNAITHGIDPEQRTRAVALGQAMMDEIMSKRWDENSPVGGGPIITGESLAASGTVCSTTPYSCTGNRLFCFACRNPGYVPVTASINTAFNDGESRQNFDDVDDYDGLIETNTFIDQSNQTVTMQGFIRTVTVRYIASNSDPIDQNTGVAAGITDTKLIIITVTSPLNETFTLVGISCNL